MGNAEYKREIKKLRASKNLCLNCGLMPPKPNQTQCENCCIKQAQYQKAHHQRLISKKLCTRCGKPSYQSYKICQECRAKEFKGKRDAFALNGMCKTCGRKPIRGPQYTLCQDCRDRLIKNKRLNEKRNKIKVFNHYGNHCVCCGESNKEFLTIDHKNNDGAAHKKSMKTKSSYSVINWIIKHNYPDTFQILCFNCNCAKGIYGICPHQKQITEYITNQILT